MYECPACGELAARRNSSGGPVSKHRYRCVYCGTLSAVDLRPPSWPESVPIETVPRRRTLRRDFKAEEAWDGSDQGSRPFYTRTTRGVTVNLWRIYDAREFREAWRWEVYETTREDERPLREGQHDEFQGALDELNAALREEDVLALTALPLREPTGAVPPEHRALSYGALQAPERSIPRRER